MHGLNKVVILQVAPGASLISPGLAFSQQCCKETGKAAKFSANKAQG